MIKKIKIQYKKGFLNVNTRVIQFVCTHRRSHKTRFFEKEQSIA